MIDDQVKAQTYCNELCIVLTDQAITLIDVLVIKRVREQEFEG